MFCSVAVSASKSSSMVVGWSGNAIGRLTSETLKTTLHFSASLFSLVALQLGSALIERRSHEVEAVQG
jgi:hypothetical protein